MGKTAELSCAVRTLIVSKFKAGAAVKDIANEFQLSRQTVHYQINKFRRHNGVTNLPRLGAKRKTTPDEDQILLRAFTKNIHLKPKTAASQFNSIAKNPITVVSKTISERTVRRRLKEAVLNSTETMAQNKYVDEIKKECEEEKNVDKHIEPENWNTIKVKMESDVAEELENPIISEIDIGPIKIEEGLNKDLTEECDKEKKSMDKVESAQQLPSVVPAAKSNNSRIIVRELHQRLMKLDKPIEPREDLAARAPSLPSSSTGLDIKQERPTTLNVKLEKQPDATMSSTERMRDLRQRLMNLEKAIKEQDEKKLFSSPPTPSCTISSSSESNSQAKSSAQRMRELRQRRREQIVEPVEYMGNQRPQTPPEVIVKRRREFRDRPLNLDELSYAKHEG